MKVPGLLGLGQAEYAVEAGQKLRLVRIVHVGMQLSSM